MVVNQLNIISLREQVYDYLRRQMADGDLTPGATIHIGNMAEQLGISKTPLRDALIHLEVEGFVTILPRKGVKVNTLTLLDIKHAYDAAGIVESSIVLDCFDKITPAHILKMEKLNEKMIRDIEKNDFTDFFNTNLEFHDIYINISDNDLLKNFINPIKHRLYDFPRHNYLAKWEMRNCEEHRQFLDLLKAKDPLGAAKLLKNTHWSFNIQEKFIREFYKMIN